MELLDAMNTLTIKNTQNNNEQQLFRSISVEINDVPTEIVLAEYTDKTLLIVSQYRKVGTMFMVQKDQVPSPSGTSTIFTTKVLFGAAGEEQEVAARYLAEAIKITKPLCIFINLKSYTSSTVTSCRDIILDLKKETQN